MATVGRLAVEIGTKLSGLQSGLRNAQGMVSQASRRMGRAAGGMRDAFGGVLRTVANLRTAIAALAGGASLGLLARSFLQAASTSEQLRTRLTVLLGSVSEGNRLFDEMRKFAGRVPFEFEQIMGAATQLSGVMTGGVDQIRRWMPLIADLAAASGLSIQQTTEQVIRMFSAGAASADLFRERGILAMLGFQAGVSVSAEETRVRLMEAWQSTTSMFRGATERLATTWEGTMSMLSDKWFQFRTQVMEAGLFNHLKAMATVVNRDLGNAMEKNTELAQRWSNRMISGIEVIAKGIGFVADAFRGWQIIIKTIDIGLSGLNVIIGKVLQVAEESIRMFVNNSIAVINLLIEGMNKIPGVNLNLISQLERGNFATEIEIMTLRAEARVLSLQTELIKLSTTPMPSEGIADFFRRVREEAARTAGAVSGAMGGDPRGEGEGRGGEGDTTREQLGQRMEQIREFIMTREETERLAHERRMETLRTAWEEGIIPSEARFRAIVERLEAKHQKTINDIREKGLTKIEQFQAMSWHQQTATVLDELATMTAGVAQHNKTMFRINKAVAIAQAIINTYRGITRTLAEYPWPLAGIMAAAHAAAGFAQVSAIRSTSFSGGGAGSAPSIAGTTPAAPVTPVESTAQSQDRQVPREVVVQVESRRRMFSREEVEGIIEQINEVSGDGVRLRVAS